SDAVPDQELALRHQRPVDSREIQRQCIASSGLNLGRDGSTEQRQQVPLSIPREDETGVEEAVDPRSFVGTMAVQWKPSFPEPGDGAHDAVRLEDPDLAIRTESSRGGAERMRIHECARLAKHDPPEARLTDLHFAAADFFVAR